LSAERWVAILCSFLLIFTTGCGHISRPADEAIVTGIQAKMFSDPTLKAALITVTAKDGVVTLSGELPDDAARQAAQKIAADTKGVSKIIDQTTIAKPQTAAVALPAAVAEEKPIPGPSPKPARPSAASAPAKHRTAVTNAQNSGDATMPVTSRDVIPGAAPAQATDPGPVAKVATAPLPVAVALAAPPPHPKPQPVTVTIPEGTVISVHTIDKIDSSVNTAGQTFKASLDAPILVEDKVVVPKDLNVTLKLVNASSAGHMSGRSELTVSLDNFIYQGKRYTVASSDVQEKGGSRGKRSAAVIGGGAVLGAIIGGIAGGGKGAAIGAAAGGGTGTAVQAMTKGEQVKISSETKLDFTLHAPLDVSYIPAKKIAAANASGTAGPPDSQTPAASPAPQTDPTPDGMGQTQSSGSQPPEN
jgi:hypothetical protein